MTTLQIHPAIRGLPPVEGVLLDALIRNIRLKGQQLPIALYQGMVWDGRARLAACTALGVKPWLVPLRRRDPVELYIEHNYERMGEPRSTKRTWLLKTERVSWATATATVVLPIPPGPTIVTNLCAASFAWIAAMVCFRPTIRAKRTGNADREALSNSAAGGAELIGTVNL